MFIRRHQQCPECRQIADRHYNRRKAGSSKFCPPGRQLVLLSEDKKALWVSLFQKPEYTDHQWPGAWVNSLFRNEGPELASRLIRRAVAVTCFYWRPIPASGLITFVDPKKIKPKQHPGYCYIKAGFREIGKTKTNKLLVFQLLPEDMPEQRRALDDDQMYFNFY